MEQRQSLTNEFDLLSSLSPLQQALERLNVDLEAIGERQPPKLERLEKIIARLGEGKTSKPVLCPGENLQQWKDYLAGKLSTLEWRVVRSLCWEQGVVTDIRFQNYLDRYWPDLNARSLQGMVRCCHLKWMRETANITAINRVQQRLRKYQGPNRLLGRWRDAATMLLGANGPTEFAHEIIKHQSSIVDACRDWKLDEQTGYVEMAVEAAAGEVLSPQSIEADAKNFMSLLLWNHWPIDKFKRILGKTILHSLAENSESWRSELIEFILIHPLIGDPRQDSTRWGGVPEEARKRFVQWMSRADIVFFFDRVLRGNDLQGRRKFWLQYVGRLCQSRPLLRNADEVRLSAEIRDSQGGNANYGRVNGGASSFLLDFGPIVAIEFSTLGATYFYNRETFNDILPNLWQRVHFSEASLQNRDRACGWIAHKPDWEDEAASLLAKYDIRPG
jgi:EH signature protein